MLIELLGLSGAKIQTNDTVLLLAPPAQNGELKASRFKADCAVLGAPGDKVNVGPITEKLFVVGSSGEFETSGIFIYCTQTPAKERPASLMSLVKIESMSLAHLGWLGHDLTDDQLELFEGSDILLIPVGGSGVLDAKKAKEIVEKIEPHIVIPMHFAQKGLKTPYDGPEKFFKEIGSSAQPQARVKITKKDLSRETMWIVNLQT